MFLTIIDGHMLQLPYLSAATKESAAVSSQLNLKYLNSPQLRVSSIRRAFRKLRAKKFHRFQSEIVPLK